MRRPFTHPAIRSRVAWTAAVAAWVALLLGGFGALLAYEFRSGAQDQPPVSAAAVLDGWLGDRPYQLVVALHPKCPCSRATVAELERLKAQCDGNVDCIVLVAAPTGAGDDWLDAPLVREIRERLGATIVHDANSALAGQLGMQTSGAVLLLDDEGRTRFFGGVTASRGHEGDNIGAAAIGEILCGRHAEIDCSPVFGCRLVH